MDALKEMIKNDLADDSDESYGSEEEETQSPIEIMASTFGKPINRETKLAKTASKEE